MNKINDVEVGDTNLADFREWFISCVVLYPIKMGSKDEARDVLCTQSQMKQPPSILFTTFTAAVEICASSESLTTTTVVTKKPQPL